MKKNNKINDIHSTVKSIDNKLNKLLDYQTAEQYQREILQISFNDWLDKWEEMFKQGLKPSTLYKISCLRNKYIDKTLGAFPLSELSAIDIQRFLITIKAPRQAQHLYTLLKDSLTRAYSLDLIIKNPMKALPKPIHQKKPGKAFDHEQQSRLEKAISNNRYAVIFFIMLYAGLRKGEALALTYADIDLTSLTISITKTINYKNELNSPKTKLSTRQVPIFDNLLPYLQRYASNTPQRLFTINPANLNKKHFSRILEQSELSKQGFNIHSLRHTFTTRCIENGVPPKVLQKWLGHSTIEMTMNVYAHINRDFENQAIKNLNNKLIKNNKNSLTSETDNKKST